MEKILFTSESVTEGHPDKIADQISDGVLDAILAQDPNARVACETVVNTGLVVLVGEITTTATVDYQQIARDTIRKIGYADRKYGYDADYLPMPIYLSHQLAYQLAKVRKEKQLNYLGPDGKVQVTVEYTTDHKVKRIDTIVVSTQHDEEISQEQIHRDILEYVVKPVVPSELLDDETRYFINPTGKFVIGGPVGDSGLTGRKIIVDTYGGYARHGGGAFSGKDATKVDRSASYAARYIAKNVVAAGLADKCEIQLAYAIGVAQPVSISVDTFGTNHVSEEKLIAAIRKVFKLTPKGIIETLQLRRPIYQQTAAYGHFGRKDVDLPWEQLDKVEALKAEF